MDAVFRSRRVVLPGGVRPAAVHVSGGRIERVAGWNEVPAVSPVRDFGDLVLSPGLVDTHVHVNEPGRTEWEGFATATRAAAAGGVTTIVDMPLNSIPATTTALALEAKRAAAEGKCHVDVAFVGGVVPGNVADLAELRLGGVLGFKCFLSPSGVPEFDPVGEADLRAALPVLTDLGAPLLVHAELPDSLQDVSGDPTRYESWLRARPDAAEDRAVDLVVRLARETGARVHVVHLSSAGALGAIARAKDDGVQLTVETCPHYLCLAAEDVPDGATLFKCAPPIRGKGNREHLWGGLVAGLVDQIVSDHSPSPPQRKRGGFDDAWGGIASLELGLAVVWTEAQTRGLTIADLAERMSAAPARLVGLERKGRIAPGADADFCVWSPEATRIVGALHQRHPLTPYAGRTLFGVVEETILGGVTVFEKGSFSPPRGRFVRC
jgi:allantoinase